MGYGEITTYGVNNHRGEDGSRDSWAILGVLDAADEFMVLGPEEPAEDGEDDDGEDGDDYAITRRGLSAVNNT